MAISKNQEEKFIHMTQTPPDKLVREMAGPTLISMMVTSLYNMADTFFVSQLHNTSSTGAIGVIFPVMTIISALGFTLGQGSGNHLSRALGRRDDELARSYSGTGFGLGLGCGFVLLVLGWLFLSPLVELLGATETIRPYAMSYGGIILTGAPWMITATVINCQLRLQGSARFSMWGLVSGAILNMILDPLLILLLKLGVAGAALATVISQFVSFAVLYWGTTRGGNVRPELRRFTLRPEIHRNIISTGFPAFIRHSLMSVSTLCINNAARVYGDAVIAAVSIVSRITSFAHSAALGLGQGFQPVCGFNYGAKLYHRVLEAYMYTLKLIFVVLLAASLLGLMVPGVIVGAFSSDAQVLEYGARLLRITCTVFYLQSFSTLSNMLLQNIGKTGRASLLSAARQGLFFIPGVLIFSRLWGREGLLYVQMCSDLLAFLLALPLTLPVLRELSGADGAKKAI